MLVFDAAIKLFILFFFCFFYKLGKRIGLEFQEAKNIEKGVEFVSLSGAFCKRNVRFGNNLCITWDTGYVVKDNISLNIQEFLGVF